jgi:hypothetical protein
MKITSSAAPGASNASRSVARGGDGKAKANRQAAAAIGTRNQYTALQPHCAISVPASSGPSAPPMANIIV